jgi:hypothetical protein
MTCTEEEILNASLQSDARGRNSAVLAIRLETRAGKLHHWNAPGFALEGTGSCYERRSGPTADAGESPGQEAGTLV